MGEVCQCMSGVWGSCEAMHMEEVACCSRARGHSTSWSPAQLQHPSCPALHADTHASWSVCWMVMLHVSLISCCPRSPPYLSHLVLLTLSHFSPPCSHILLTQGLPADPGSRRHLGRPFWREARAGLWRGVVEHGDCADPDCCSNGAACSACCSRADGHWGGCGHACDEQPA